MFQQAVVAWVRRHPSWVHGHSAVFGALQRQQSNDQGIQGSRGGWHLRRSLHSETDAAREQAAAMAREMKAQRGGMNVFDGPAKAAHRDRAAHWARTAMGVLPSPSSPSSPPSQQQPASSSQSTGSQPQSGSTETGQLYSKPYREDPLLAMVADRLVDRLDDISGRTFKRVAVIGGAAIHVLDCLAKSRAGGSVQAVTVVDTSPGMAALVQDMAASGAWPKLSVTTALMDPGKEILPLEPNSLDLVVSCLGLHWFNDLPGVLAQCRLALVPDGLMLGALFGGDTLQELRIVCAVAAMERRGGVSPVVSPFAQVRDGGNLLTRAGLSLPTVDVDEVVARYAGGPPELVAHLRSLGEGNAVAVRQRHAGRDVALAADATYRAMFGDSEDGSVGATFQVMYLTGWCPHASQQKPAKRGSATVSFQDLADGLVAAGSGQGGATGEGGDEDG
eukprot:CAMPEP_0202879816 /NCGR_PEP_ID=MMETSP1391-20130828/34146_1 /ASSEMBLY_ACC=CAM_ASM_000867 /TAXON_ID=1034604 /ORGANISM="Chlamydomonas leiostraca, Strain SAG 11-49" /LENGTH=446 /DNA_ID=CAMNT_0049562219 /DNA_START=221 /DNA_END=1558 /DNA_ORIENTATION=+